MESDILSELCQIVKDFSKQDLIAVVNKALEFINGYEKKDKRSIDISHVITVDVPFSPNGVLGQSQNHFVIFDTPGSNSHSNADHSLVLEEALRGFSNGIPVWVSQYESMDSEDNANLCERILSIKALDNRFTMIVLNKADGSDLPEDGFTPRQIQDILEYRAVEKMYASGIFFVSSIMGLGAKNHGELRDKHYRRIYRSQQEMYSDPEDMDYATLYRYDIMPEQIKTEISRLSEEFEDQNGLIYANSGLFCIEKEMEDFASKYSAYNKCQMVLIFLNEVIAETTRRIANRTSILRKSREKWQLELNTKRQELLNSIKVVATDRERDFSRDTRILVRTFATKELDYSCDAAELEKMDKQVATQHSADANFSSQESGFAQAKNAMWDHVKTHGQSLLSGDIKHSLLAMKADFLDDLARVQESKESMDTARRTIDSHTSDVIMGIVVDKYKASLLEAKERISSSTKLHWQQNAQSLKEQLISIVTESDALSSTQREQLSNIIMDYKPLEFNDDADDVFIKTKFLRGNIWGILVSDSERLNIRRLAAKYNERMSKNIMEMAMHLNDSCAASYKIWQALLLSIIEQNIAEYNPQLRDMTEMIREETEKILELENDQQTISASLEAIRQLMSWKDVEFEEMQYGS